MKNNNPINYIFIGIVAVLLILAVVSFSNQSAAQVATSEETTPTIDVLLSVTQTMGAVWQATIAVQPTETPLAPTITPLPPTPTAFLLPDEFYIKGFKGHVQYYSIGCETSTAVDLAEFLGKTIYQFDFQMALPHSDNPDLGFVGDVNGPWGQIPPYAYGVHATPIVDTLNQFGIAAEGGKGYTLEQIKEKIAQGKPVIVWVIGKMEYSDPIEYIDEAGTITIVAPYEHVVVLTGYNATTLRYVSNGNLADVQTETFLKSWGVLGNMAVMPK